MDVKPKCCEVSSSTRISKLSTCFLHPDPLEVLGHIWWNANPMSGHVFLCSSSSGYLLKLMLPSLFLLYYEINKKRKPSYWYSLWNEAEVSGVMEHNKMMVNYLTDGKTKSGYWNATPDSWKDYLSQIKMAKKSARIYLGLCD